MKINYSIDWYVENNVGAKTFRGNGVGVDCYFGDEVGTGDGEEVELKVVYEVSLGDVSSIKKGVKVVVGIGVGGSVYWGVDRGFIDGYGSPDRIIFVIDYGSDIV